MALLCLATVALGYVAQDNRDNSLRRIDLYEGQVKRVYPGQKQETTIDAVRCEEVCSVYTNTKIMIIEFDKRFVPFINIK